MEINIYERIATLEAIVDTIKNDILEIKDKLLGRPSWGVSILITFLTTISTGLIIYIITK